MPIDTETQAFLDSAKSKPGAPPGSVPLEEFRQAVEPFRALGFDREDVHQVDLIDLPRTGAPSVSIRLYRPDAEGPLPVMVWAHGGSWVRVTVDLMDHHFRTYVNRSGCAFAAVDYRLAPETRFPEQISEVHAAALWLKDNARELGLDPARIGVGGESSGGNLAAAAALLDRDRGEVGFAHQALILPVLDVTFASKSWDELGSDFLLTRAQLEWAVEQYAPGIPRTDPRLSPVFATSLDGLPPTLVITGEFDPLRDEGSIYAHALERANVPVDYRCQPGLIHHAIMAPKLMPAGRELVETSAAMIGHALRGPVAAG